MKHSVSLTPMQPNSFLPISCTLFLALAALSNVYAVGLPQAHRADGWFVGAQLGQLWSSLSDGLTVNNGSPYSPPYNLDSYSLHSNQQSALALMGGYKWFSEREWIPAYTFGIRYQHFFSSNVMGSITQYSLPQFLNYDYSWAISTHVLGLNSKIDLFQYARFTPFFDVGIGIDSIQTSRYRERALPGVTSRLTPGFSNHTQNNLAYNVGAGVDYALKEHILLSLGYDYEYLGDFNSGVGLSTWSAQRLHAGHYKGNMLSLGVTYYFENKDVK